MFGQINVYIATLVIVGVSLMQSLEQQRALMGQISGFMVKKNLKPKPLLYPAVTGTIFLLFCLYQVVDSW